MFIKLLYKVFAFSAILTLAVASAAFAQLTSTLSIDDVTVTEGDAGTANATFTVTRSGNTTLVSTVNFATTDDAATQPDDYASSSGILTFATGETAKTVTVSVKGDILDETDETFFVNLSSASVGTTLSDGQGVGTISDDDYTPQANDDGSAAGPITLSEDDPSGVATNVLANDTGLADTPISVEVTSPPSKGTATINADKTITYSPNANQNGPDTYEYTVTDSDGQTSTATVHLYITPVNDALIISSVTDDGPVGEGSPATITVAVSDPDGDTLSYEFDCNNDNAFEIGPQPAKTALCIFNDEGSYRVNVRVSDGNTDAATGFTDVTVNNVAPNAGNDSASADEAGPDAIIDVLSNDTDASGDPLAITGNTQPPAGKGSVSCSTNDCAFTPDADFNGTTGFTYSISDGDGGTDTATVNVTVAAVNDAPTISDISDQSIDEDTSTGAIAFTVGDVETSAADLTVSGSSSNTALVPNANITFAFGGSGANRTVTLTPASGQTGTTTITVTANDGNTEATDTFILTVRSADDVVPMASVTTPKKRNGNAMVQFSEPMNPTTLMLDTSNPVAQPTTSQTIVLLKGTSTSTTVVPAMVSCTDSTCQTVILDPDKNLAKRKKYTVKVEGVTDIEPLVDSLAVEDPAGNKLAQDSVKSFKTGAR